MQNTAVVLVQAPTGVLIQIAFAGNDEVVRERGQQVAVLLLYNFPRSDVSAGKPMKTVEKWVVYAS